MTANLFILVIIIFEVIIYSHYVLLFMFL